MSSSRTDPLVVLRLACGLGGAAQSLAGSAGALLAAGIAGDDAAGLPQGILVLGAALAALALSAITQRRGRQPALAVGIAVGAAGCVAIAAGAESSSLAGVLAGSLLLGSGNTSVMLSRYAAADLVAEERRPLAMASVLVATTVGAVAGPNLLAPSGRLATSVGLQPLTGAYLVALVLFGCSLTAVVRGLPSTRPAAEVAGTVRPPLGRDGITGLAVLATANLVMVGVMTMATVHLHHLGAGLGVVGLVVSAHIAGMFALSGGSGRIVARLGAQTSAVCAIVVIAAAAGVTAVSSGDLGALALALLLVGLAWNLALVAGSTLLTAGVPEAARPSREGWGELGMGVAAAGGGVASGPIVVSGGYSALAVVAASVATLMIPFAWRLTRPGPSRRQRWSAPYAS